jgi:osmotically-inducible protein OsmY
MKWLGRISAAIAAAAAGAGATLLLHRRSGAESRKAAAGVARRQSATVAAMVGSSVSRTPGRRGRNEAQLVDSVRSELSARHHVSLDALQVTSHKGTVTLRGEVSRLADIDAFEQTARAVSGVRDVNNLLRLAASSRTPTKPAPPASAAP